MMNDPHVEWLLYRFEPNDYVGYDREGPFAHETKTFRLRVEEWNARFDMKEHFATAGEAKEAVEQFIRKWEFRAVLERGPNALSLQFARAHIVDREAIPGSYSIALQGHGGAWAPRLSGAIAAHSPYPTVPAKGIELTPDVLNMYERFLGYQRGEGKLPDTAYFCFTVLMEPRGEPVLSEIEAACRYDVSRNVLKRIKVLASRKGGKVGRKADTVDHELSCAEVRFLERSIAALIYRAAEVAHAPEESRKRICMSDLPPH